MKTKIKAFCAILLLLILILSSCRSSFVGLKIGGMNHFIVSFYQLDRSEVGDLYVNEGKVLSLSVALTEGYVNIHISEATNNSTIFVASSIVEDKFDVYISNSARYIITVTGTNARGHGYCSIHSKTS